MKQLLKEFIGILIALLTLYLSVKLGWDSGLREGEMFLLSLATAIVLMYVYVRVFSTKKRKIERRRGVR